MTPGERTPNRVPTLAATIAVSIGVIGIITALTLWGGKSAATAESEVILLGSTNAPAGVESFRRVDDVSALRPASERAAVLILDEAFARSLKPGSMREFVAQGYTVIGINVPLDQLIEFTSFIDEIALIDPKYAEAERKPATFKGDFFTVVWRTSPDAVTQRWNLTQQDMTPGLFAAILDRQQLLTAGLARNEDGTLVPLEQY